MNAPEPVEVSVQEGYAIWAEIYDTMPNALIALEELYVRDLLPKLTGSRLLDVGAGTGRYALRLARQGFNVTAIDCSEEMLSVAKNAALAEDLNIEFLTAPFEDTLPFESNSFDVVVCALVLCHVTNLSKIAREFSRVLVEGGQLLLTDLHPDAVAAGLRTALPHKDALYYLPNMPHTRDDYLKAIRDADFEILEVYDLPTKEAPEELNSEPFLEKFGDVNFSLITLSRKL